MCSAMGLSLPPKIIVIFIHKSHPVQCLVIEPRFKKSNLIITSERGKGCIFAILTHKQLKDSDRLVGVGLEAVLGLTGYHRLCLSCFQI